MSEHLTTGTTEETREFVTFHIGDRLLARRLRTFMMCSHSPR